MDMFIAILWIIMFLSLLATIGGFVLLFIFHLTKTETRTLKKIIISTGLVCLSCLIISMIFIFCTSEPTESNGVDNIPTQYQIDITPTPKPTKAPTSTPTPVPTNTPTPTPYVETEQDYKNSCGRYNYKDILRNPDNYKEERIKVELKVKSIHEYGFLGDKYYICSASDEYGWNGDTYVVYDFRENDFKILEDDIICVYGEIKGLTEVTYILFGNDEVVKIHMQYGELINE